MTVQWIVINICQVGGVEKVVVQLSNYFVKNNISVEIVSLYSHEKENVHFDLDKRVKRYDCGFKCFSYYDYYFNIRKILKKSNADIIIGTHEMVNIALVLNRRVFNGKIIVSQHVTNDYYTKTHFMANCMLYKKVNAFTVLNKGDTYAYIKKGVSNIVAIPNALTSIAEKKSELKEKNIITVGRMVSIKGFDTLIDAFAIVNKKYPEWSLTILGDGPEREDLEKQIAELNLQEKIKLPGFVKNVNEWMLNSSIYVLSSRGEGFPMVLLEAMSWGLPIVSFNLPSTVEMLEEEVGILASEHTSESLAESMIMMMESQQKRCMYAEKSCNRIMRYTMDAVGKQWIELFQKI